MDIETQFAYAALRQIGNIVDEFEDMKHDGYLDRGRKPDQYDAREFLERIDDILQRWSRGEYVG